MASTNGASFGFLDKAERAYLEDKGQRDGYVIDSDIEKRVAEKTGAAIEEFGLVFDYLDVNVLDTYFSDTANESEFKEGIEGTFALGYWALLRSNTDPISILENAIELAETVNLPLNKGIDVIVTCRIEKELEQIEVGELLENLRTEDPLELLEDLAVLGLATLGGDDIDDNAVYMTLTEKFPGTIDDVIEVLDVDSTFETDSGNQLAMERVSSMEVKFVKVD